MLETRDGTLGCLDLAGRKQRGKQKQESDAAFVGCARFIIIRHVDPCLRAQLDNSRPSCRLKHYNAVMRFWRSYRELEKTTRLRFGSRLPLHCCRRYWLQFPLS